MGQISTGVDNLPEELDKLAEHDPETGRWNVVGDYEENSQERREEATDAIVAALRDGPQRVIHIASQVGKSEDAVSVCLRRGCAAKPPKFLRVGHGLYDLPSTKPPGPGQAEKPAAATIVKPTSDSDIGTLKVGFLYSTTTCKTKCFYN